MCMGGGGSSNPQFYTAGNVPDRPQAKPEQSTDPRITAKQVAAQKQRMNPTLLTGDTRSL